MEDDIRPPPNLDELTVDQVYQAMQDFKIPEIVALRFKEQMIDGEIISKMDAIPVALIPEIGIQIRFCNFYEFYTGKIIEYPNDYMIPQYRPIEESRNGDDTINGEMVNDYENVVPRKRRRLTGNGRYMAPPPPTTPPPSTQQSLQPTLASTPAIMTPTSLVTTPSQPKRPITYPAPLPVFSPVVEAKLQDPSQSLNAVMLMNRELIDFYVGNNFELSKSIDYRHICETLLNKYGHLNQAVTSVVDLENRIRGRRVPMKSWQFLSKKLAVRHRYCKNKGRLRQFEHLQRDPLQEQQENAIRQIENDLVQTTSPQTTDRNQLELVDSDENNNNFPQQQEQQQQAVEDYYEEYDGSNGNQQLLQGVDFNNNNNNADVENIVHSISTQQLTISQEDFDAASCIFFMSNNKNLNLLNADQTNDECPETNSDSNQQQFVNNQQNNDFMGITHLKEEENAAEIDNNSNFKTDQQQEILNVYDFESQWVLNNLVNAVYELSQVEEDYEQHVNVTESLLPNDNDIQTINRLAAQMENNENSNEIMTSKVD